MNSVLDNSSVEAESAAAAGSVLTWYLTALSPRHMSESEEEQLSRYSRAAVILDNLTLGAGAGIRSVNIKQASSYQMSPTALELSDVFRSNIDVPNAYGIVQDDAFLQPYEKESVLGLLSSAQQPDGRTSQYGLARTALKAGIQFLPAYAFGRLAGKVLGFKPDTAKRLSAAGALAYAVRSSGLLKEL